MFVQPSVVELMPVDPFQGGHFDLVHNPQGPAGSTNSSVHRRPAILAFTRVLTTACVLPSIQEVDNETEGSDSKDAPTNYSGRPLGCETKHPSRESHDGATDQGRNLPSIHSLELLSVGWTYCGDS